MRQRAITTGVITAVALLAAQVTVLAGCGACGDQAGKKEKKGCGEGCEKPKAAQVAKQAEATINTDGVRAVLQAGAPVTVLDARSGKYDDGRRIPGAKSLNAGSSAEEVTKTLPDKNALVITYCAGLKCGASHQLADSLKKAGYANVIEYPEGIAGWAEAGNKMEKAAQERKGE